MKTGEDIMTQFPRKRDYSGSLLDSYAQDLGTFFSSCILKNELEAFTNYTSKYKKQTYRLQRARRR